MWQLLEESLLTCRQEWQNFVVIVGPALLLGPVLALIATIAPLVALVLLPIVLLVCLVAYAACVRAMARMFSSLSPEPVDTYFDLVPILRDVVQSGSSGLLVVGGALAAALTLAELDQHALAALAVVGSAAVAFVWGLQHAYHHPLMFAHNMRTEMAGRMSASMVRMSFGWTAALAGVLAVPLALAALVSWGLAFVVTPSFGATMFALAAAAWMPLPAITFTNACIQILGSVSEEEAQEWRRAA